MPKLNPAHISLKETDDDDPRIGHLIGSQLEDEELPGAVLIGFPSDEGVRRNGGRPGAAQAPDFIRERLYGMTPDVENPDAFRKLIGRIRDLGNLEVSGDVEADQQELGELVALYLEQGAIPIILGGGHETAFGHFLGYAKSKRPASILNIDAHTDVRPLKKGKAHSGSPFRQAIQHESGCCEQYLVAGLQPYAVAQRHLAFIEEHGGSVKLRDETNITTLSGLFHEHESERMMMTLDMDAVDQAFAPGVSAPCANGLPSDLWLMAAYMAGRRDNVTSLDIVEFNPTFDRDGQTARLAALTIWNFLQGLAQR